MAGILIVREESFCGDPSSDLRYIPELSHVGLSVDLRGTPETASEHRIFIFGDILTVLVSTTMLCGDV